MVTRKSNDRKSMQVSPEFHKQLDDIRRKVIISGEDISIRELTKKIAQSGVLNNFEKKLLKMEVMNIKFDMRVR